MSATMTTGEQLRAWQRAGQWAHGPWRTRLGAAHEMAADPRAMAYADWYLREYIRRAQSMADLPEHPAAWERFLSEQPAWRPVAIPSHWRPWSVLRRHR